MQELKVKMDALIHTLYQNDNVRRVVHTFWQAAAGALLAGLLAVHSTADVKGVLTVAFAAGLSAVKALLTSRKA